MFVQRSERIADRMDYCRDERSKKTAISDSVFNFLVKPYKDG